MRDLKFEVWNLKFEVRGSISNGIINCLLSIAYC